MRVIKATALVMAGFLTLSSSVYAASVGELQNKKNQVKNQMSNLDKKIDAIQDKKDNLGDQIDSINAKIFGVQDTLDDLDSKLDANQAKLKSITAEVNEMTKKQNTQEAVLKDRLVVYYENGGMSYVDILLNSKSFSDLLARYEVVKQILGFDQSIMDEIQEEKEKLDAKKREVELTSSEIADEKQRYEITKGQFELAKSQKNQLMKELTTEQRMIQNQYDELEASSNQIARQIQQLQISSSSSPYTGGKLAWPTPGYYTVTSPFGMRMHPILHCMKMHNGIDTSAPAGANLVAAGDGVVRIAGNVSGYGNTVVLDLGGGISTLVGHASVILVSVGQQVKKGDVIARVGSTGMSTGPHAHFEVRKNGTPVDPLSWLK